MQSETERDGQHPYMPVLLHMQESCTSSLVRFHDIFSRPKVLGQFTNTTRRLVKSLPCGTELLVRSSLHVPVTRPMLKKDMENRTLALLDTAQLGKGVDDPPYIVGGSSINLLVLSFHSPMIVLVNTHVHILSRAY